MNEAFYVNYTVGFAGLKPDLTLCPYKIVDYFQETTIMHTESTANPMQWYADNDRGWMLASWDIEIYKCPTWKSIVTVRTWPSSFKGILGERSFEMLDQNGARIACAASKWFFADIKKRRPIRTPEEIVNGYLPLGEPVIVGDYTIPAHEDFMLVSERTFKATRRETDTNYHVNNEKYIEWAMDDVSDNIYFNQSAGAIKVNYKKECAANTPVTAKTYSVERGGSVEYISVFTDTERTSTIFAEVYTRWQ